MSASAEFSGAMRERITLEAQAPGSDTDGGLSEVWQSIGLVWAQVSPSGAGPESVGGTLSALPRYHVILRRFDDVAVGNRAIWRGATYQILNISRDPATPDRMSFEMELLR